MPENIKLTPSELQAQAAEMKSLETEYASLFGGVTSELNKVNSNWSANLAHNFKGKINSSKKSFAQITQELMNGAKVADTCAVTFESVDSQLAKVYSGQTKDGKTSFWQDFRDEQEQLDSLFSFIDDNFDKIPESARNLIKHQLLDKLKKGEVSYTDIYELLRDLSTGNISWKSAANLFGVVTDAFGIENSFVKTTKTTMEILPTYLKKAEANDAKIDQYAEEGNLGAALFTGIVGNGNVVLQGAADGICKIIDKTFHLSDLSDVIECVTFGHVDIGGFLGKAGKGISDAFDYVTNLDNYSDIGRYYKEFYGPIGDGIAKGAKAVADAAVGACKSVGNFFKNLF